MAESDRLREIVVSEEVAGFVKGTTFLMAGPYKAMPAELPVEPIIVSDLVNASHIKSGNYPWPSHMSLTAGDPVYSTPVSSMSATITPGDLLSYSLQHTLRHSLLLSLSLSFKLKIKISHAHSLILSLL